MLKRYGKVLKISLVVVVVFALWPGTLAAVSPEPDLSADLTFAVPQVQEDPFYMYSSYEWSEQTGPSQCPDPPIFRNGTRVVYSYIPAVLTQDIAAIVLWYELDENGNPTTDDPIAVGEAVLAANTLPNASLSLGQGVQGVFGAFMFVQDNSGEWIMLGVAVYAIAPADYTDVPQPGVCPLPQAAGPGDTGGGTGGDCTPELGKGSLEVVNYVDNEVVIDVSDQTGIIGTATVPGVDTQPNGGRACFQLAPGHYVIGANTPGQTAYTELNIVEGQSLILSIK
jgi:hypothetical protein